MNHRFSPARSLPARSPASGGSVAAAQDMTGAGASFPAPIYAKWADAYNKATGDELNYQSIGSGAGIKQINAKTVDFGASDMPLNDDELAKDGLMQFPTVIGGVVPVVNIKGIEPGQIKLTGEVLGDIYLGKITKWNDPAITALNPGVTLPDEAISRGAPRRRLGHELHLHQLPVQGERRLEGQGRRRHRGQLADRRRAARATKASPPFVQRLPNSIGYVEYAYAKQNKMTYTLLKNKAGNFVAPDADNFKAAAAGADWSKSFYQVLTDQPGKDAWPISGATFILMHKAQDKPVERRQRR